MAKSRSKDRSKKKGKAGIGKGTKAFLFILLTGFLALLSYMAYDRLSEALAQSKQVEVPVDLEVGGIGGEKGRFQEPWGVATAPNGHFFVTDFSGHRILEFDQNGGPVGSFGKRGKDPGEFEQPSGIYVDPAGTIFVCDTFNHRVQKFDSKGKLLKVISRSFFGPRSVGGDGRGRIYVSDTGNHKIQAFTTEGVFLQEWGGFGTAEGKFREPVGLTVDPEGFVYVADSDNLRIQKFNPSGKLIAVIKVGPWNGKNRETPYLTFSQGSLYATNASNNGNKGAVLKFSPSGALESVLKKKEGFTGAAGLAVDSQERFYVVEKGSGRVARFSITAVSH